MTSEDKMHEEFEEWFKYNYSWFIEKGMDGYSLARFEDNHRQYVDTIPHNDWRVWKASRESLVIRVNSAACHDATAGDVLDAIENSGIKWEVE